MRLERFGMEPGGVLCRCGKRDTWRAQPGHGRLSCVMMAALMCFPWLFAHDPSPHVNAWQRWCWRTPFPTFLARARLHTRPACTYRPRICNVNHLHVWLDRGIEHDDPSFSIIAPLEVHALVGCGLCGSLRFQSWLRDGPWCSRRWLLVRVQWYKREPW